MPKDDIVAFNPGKIVNGRWLVQERLGAGGCGAVYKVQDIKNKALVAALKVEKTNLEDGGVLKLEVEVLKRLAKRKHVPVLLHAGKKVHYSFLVMTMYYKDLMTIKKALIMWQSPPSSRIISEGTLLRIGIYALYAIKQIHELGYVHRDVKPGNIVVGLRGREQRMVFLIDFGMVRPFVRAKEDRDLTAPTPKRKGSGAASDRDARTMATQATQVKDVADGPPRSSRLPRSVRLPRSTRQVKEESRRKLQQPAPSTPTSDLVLRVPRRKVLLRGTLRYCSLNVHNRNEQGRCDDLVALIYVLGELYKGLPWNRMTTEKDIKEAKEELPNEKVFEDCPHELIEIMRYLEPLEYANRPDYFKIYELFRTGMKRVNAHFSDPVEWEKLIEEGKPKEKDPCETCIESVEQERTTKKAQPIDEVEYRLYPCSNPEYFRERTIDL